MFKKGVFLIIPNIESKASCRGWSSCSKAKVLQHPGFVFSFITCACRSCTGKFLHRQHYVFLQQDGIEPMWEDERNRRGGRWLITLSKQQRKMDLDRFWLETVQSGITRASYFKVALKAVIKKQMMPINSEKMGIGINEEKMAGINRNHRLALLVSLFAQGLLSVKPLIKSEKRM